MAYACVVDQECWVDLGRKLFYLDVRYTKNRNRRAIPPNAAAVAVLQYMRQWGTENCLGNLWVFGRNAGRYWRIESAFRRAREKAELQDFRIYDMRHTCASWLVMAGVDIGVIRDLLGHSSVAVTERYAHLLPRMVAGAVDKMSFFEVSGWLTNY